MNNCIICNNNSLKIVLDIGLQPISSRYLINNYDDELLHPIILGQCTSCALVQLINPVDPSELVPKYDWITFNEPEDHLDHLVSLIRKLPGINKKSKICGISYKEQSTLERFRKIAYNNLRSFDIVKDYNINNSNSGIETIQNKLTPSLSRSLVEKYSKQDVIIARHIFEHAYEPKKFIESLKLLTSDHGYIILEIPDCMKVFNSKDYTTIWEDHIMYFTTETFTNSLINCGLNLFDFKTYNYSVENSLVAIINVDQTNNEVIRKINIEDDIRRMDIFAKDFSINREKIINFLSSYLEKNGKIAVFGAGHLASAFINIMGIKDLIEFVVDDHPQKCGLYMPGSKLPIYNSEKLIDKGIKLCLSSLNPESEKKVIKNSKNFIDSGGEFLSIFPTSKIGLNF